MENNAMAKATVICCCPTFEWLENGQFLTVQRFVYLHLSLTYYWTENVSVRSNTVQLKLVSKCTQQANHGHLHTQRVNDFHLCTIATFVLVMQVRHDARRAAIFHDQPKKWTYRYAHWHDATFQAKLNDHLAVSIGPIASRFNYPFHISHSIHWTANAFRIRLVWIERCCSTKHDHNHMKIAYYHLRPSCST